MSAKPQPSPRTLEEINQQIIEIKKKIQLSEGQRKAAFEQYETERKSNADQILKLKKEVRELTISLQKNKDESAQYRVRNARLETIVGPLVNKTTEQVKEALDLQIIDLKKHMDLVKHRIKQRRSYLRAMAQDYQKYLAQKPDEEVVAKLETMFKKKSKKSKAKSEEKMKRQPENEIASPYKKKCYELQNNIHRVEVQWREAEHVKNSYRTIRSTLMEDKANFESNIQQLEEKKEAQRKDIQELQRMNAEAASTRSTARLALDREERSSLVAARVRERQATDQEALVAARKQELERLERRIFQSGKTGIGVPGEAESGKGDAGIREETNRENNEDDTEDSDKEKEKVDEGKLLREAFDKLKDVTGATNSKDVLSKFQGQRETRTRLDYLKQTTEAEKDKLEKTQQALSAELERYKFVQEQDQDKFGDDIILLKKKIEEQKERQIKNREKLQKKEELRQEICKILFKLYISLKEIGVKINKDITANPEQGHALVKTLYKELEEIVKQNKEIIEEDAETKETVEEITVVSDDEALPSTYNALLRRTPVPVQGQVVQISTPLTSGPEDEEEVPSRGFLKRQAQLVIDAKSRRKALRIPNRK